MVVPFGRPSQKGSLCAKLRSGVQLQACASEFSDIDGIGLSSRITELEGEERVIAGGSDVLKKLMRLLPKPRDAQIKR